MNNISVVFNHISFKKLNLNIFMPNILNPQIPVQVRMWKCAILNFHRPRTEKRLMPYDATATSHSSPRSAKNSPTPEP